MNKAEYRKYLFKKKEEYHKKLARLSFERKLQILSELQKIADGFRRAERKRR